MSDALRSLLARFRPREPVRQVCGNGHVVHTSWDICPYCLEEEQQMARPPRPEGFGTISLDTAQKRAPVCGWLVALCGAHEGEDFRLRLGKNVIGTSAECAVVLSGKGISRKHCTIRYEGGEFHIADLDSRNGVFVNGQRVQRHDLIDNDVIKLGEVEFEFKCRATRQRRTG